MSNALVKPAYRRQVVDNGSENLFLTGIIVSDQVCEKVLSVYHQDYLTNEYSKKIANWVNDYFQQYKQAPFADIIEIFNHHKPQIEETTANLISEFLSKLSTDFEAEVGEGYRDGKFNVDYVVDRSLNFFQTREAVIRANNALLLAERGEGAAAMKELVEVKTIDKPKAKAVDPFGEEMVRQIHLEDNSSYLFRPDGALGYILGGFDRGWLVSFLAPMKRGKSWSLMFLALLASRKRIKVLFVSCEMSPKEVAARFQTMATRRPKALCSAVFPFFDCFRNQDGSCKEEARPRQSALIEDNTSASKRKNRSDEGENQPKKKPWDVFKESVENNEVIPHQVCKACRKDNPARYTPSLWWEKQEYAAITIDEAMKIKRRENMSYGDNLRIFCGSKFSLSIDDIKAEKERLEREDNFITDMIVIDHADNLKVVNRFSEARDNVDENWKQMAKMGSEGNILILTATQGNRGSISSDSVEQEHTSEDIRKLAHVDAMFTINQTKIEKAQGVIRYGVLVHRHMEYSENVQARVLQCLSIGGVVLGSEIVERG